MLLHSRFDVAFEDLKVLGVRSHAHHSFHHIPKIVVDLSIVAKSLQAIREIRRVFLLSFLDGAAHMCSESVLPQLLLN